MNDADDLFEQLHVSRRMPNDLTEHVLHRKKLQLEAVQVRKAIVAGYQDAIIGRVVPFEGNLRSLLRNINA